MFVWTVKIEERWSHEPKGHFEDLGNDYTVAARNSEEAFRKVEKIALSKSRSFVDDDGEDVHPVEVRLIGLERGVALDA